MADILLRGEFLRGSRGFTFGDSTGVTWTFDSATNKLTLAIAAGAVGSFDEAVDDRVAALLADSTSVDFTYNDGANTLTAAVICANPTASIGLTAVNGTAATPMRSDAAPALDQGIAPTWTGVHTFNNDVNMMTHLHMGAEEIMTVNGGVVHGQLEINSDTQSIQEVHTHSATNTSVIYYARSRGTAAAPTIVQNGDYLGVLYGVGYDGTDYALGAGIFFVVTGTPGANDMPTDIVFATSPDGSQTPAEAMRIASTKLVTFAAGLTTVGAIDLGHVSDTTLSRVSAGVVAIEGSNIITAATVPVGANPTASVGLSAVNGSAATFMRSDGAPALDQGIIPTWTQTHTFSNATAFKFGTGGTELDFGVYNDVVASSNAGRIFTTDGGAGGIKPGSAGNIVIQPRSSATRSVIIATSSGSGTPANRFEIDATALTLTVPVYAPATVAGAASLRLPHGTAPSSPVNGDMWTTTAGLYVRINGTTVGPLS